MPRDYWHPEAELSGLCVLFDNLVGAPNQGVGDIEAFRQPPLIKSPLNACSGSEPMVRRAFDSTTPWVTSRHSGRNRYVRFTREREHS